MASLPRCKDCIAAGITTYRPTPHAGPRCATHHREVKKARSTVAHDKRVVATYELSPGDYDRLYEAQGRVCAICAWATGAARRLAVDHDHETNLVRGLLCSVCNRFIGYVKNDPEAFERGKMYLIRAEEANLERKSRSEDPTSEGTGPDPRDASDAQDSSG